MSLVFLDANILIYLVEDHPEHAPVVGRLLRGMIARGDRICTSSLVAGEIIAGARIHGNMALEEQYRGLLATPGWTLLPFTDDTVSHFVEIRAMSGVKAPDAIHLACAAQAGVDVFLTHDRKLTRLHISGIGFIVGLQTDIFGTHDDPV